MIKGLLQKTLLCFLSISVILLFAWSFGTAQEFHHTHPVVDSTDPVSDATEVPVSTVVKVIFNHEIEGVSITTGNAFTLKPSGGVNVPGTVTYDGYLTATFTPAADLVPGTTYEATISTQVRGVDHLDGTPGDNMWSPHTWFFTTEEGVSAPQVDHTDPEDGATGVSTDIYPTATFDQDMDPSTINNTSFMLEFTETATTSLLLSLSEGTNVEKTGALASNRARTMVNGTVEYDSSYKEARFIPDDLLAYGTEYRATITTGVQSSEGVALESDYTWSFTTEEGVSAPQVDHTDPPDNATGVQRDIILAATFTEDMNPSTINDTSFMLEETGALASSRARTMVNGTVEYDSSYKEARFIPDTPLAYGTEYIATITTAAQNLSGVPLAEDYIWSFSTETEPTEEETLYSPDLLPGQYQMISVPLWASDPLDVFGDDLGPYDPMVWRLFWTDPHTGWYLEYPDVPDISPGVAYWLVTRDGGTVDATGEPVTDETFFIDIPPGWFQLGNPYNANVSKSDLRVELTETLTTSLLSSLREGNNEERSKKDDIASQARTPTTVPFSESPFDDVLWEWDASINNWTTTDTMVPWGGWLVYNNSENPVTLVIPNPGTGVGAGSLQVLVRDATTADEIVGATATLNGFTATTNEYGYATIPDTPTGTFTLTISMPGYVTYQQEITLEVGPNDLIVDLSPQLAEGQIRIVLAWGENPDDLDSHLTGPLAAGGRFHLYFIHVGSPIAGAGAIIDRDARYGFGPETITITELRSGTYRYYVYDYHETGTLSQSGARVDVYGEEGLLTTFSVPSGSGVYWYVFDLDGETGAITPVNTIGPVAPTSIISTDLEGSGRLREAEAEDIFRRLPRKPYGN